MCQIGAKLAHAESLRDTLLWVALATNRWCWSYREETQYDSEAATSSQLDVMCSVTPVSISRPVSTSQTYIQTGLQWFVKLYSVTDYTYCWTHFHLRAFCVAACKEYLTKRHIIKPVPQSTGSTQWQCPSLCLFVCLSVAIAYLSAIG